MQGSFRALVGLVTALSLAFLASPALADAEVEVKLRNKDGSPGAGRVVLRDDAEKEVAACTAKEGTCAMAKVPGGNYRAHVEPEAGEPPKPRAVMIPPSGKVSLIIATGK